MCPTLIHHSPARFQSPYGDPRSAQFAELPRPPRLPRLPSTPSSFHPPLSPARIYPPRFGPPPSLSKPQEQPTDTSYLDALPARVENRETAPEDGERLRRLVRTHHYLPQHAQAFAGRLSETQEDGQHQEDTRGRRAGSAAITYVRERLYTRGELILQTFYRLDDGGTDQDRGSPIRPLHHRH